MSSYDSGCSRLSPDLFWIPLLHLTYTGFSCVVVHSSIYPLPRRWSEPLLNSMLFHFSLHSDLGSDSKSRSKPANLFAFDAPSFHPIYAATFLINFFQYIIIEGRTFDSAIGQLLNTSGLSHHSGIMCFWTHNSKVKECLLKWAHSHTQPWGQPVPYQCPSCRCIQAWDQKGQGTSSELGRDVTMWCSYKDEQGQCSECLTFVRPGSTPFKPIKLSEGVWMAIGLKKSDLL